MWFFKWEKGKRVTENHTGLLKSVYKSQSMAFLSKIPYNSLLVYWKWLFHYCDSYLCMNNAALSQWNTFKFKLKLIQLQLKILRYTHYYSDIYNIYTCNEIWVMIHWNRCICSNHLSVSTILPLIVDLYCFSMDVLRRLDCLLFVFLNNCNSLFYTVFLQSYLINIWFYSVRKYSGYRFEPQFNHFCNCSEISQICDWIFMNVWKQIQRMFEIGFLEKNHESTINSIFLHFVITNVRAKSEASKRRIWSGCPILRIPESANITRLHEGFLW